MAAPRGKGIYDRGQGLSRQMGAAYAASIGCNFVMIHGLSSDREREVRAAKSAGLDVWLWSGPTSWEPPNWRDTMQRLAARSRELGVKGFVVDAETAPAWRRAGRGAAGKLARAMATHARSGLSVGFTSFPGWPYVQTIASIAGPAGVWASPQVYGIISPERRAGELRQRNDSWKGKGFASVLPSIAGWQRDAQEQRAYQAQWTGERAVIYWIAATPPSRGPRFEVLREMRAGGPLGRLVGLIPGLEAAELAILAVAVAAAVALTLKGKA